jgi:hypothetical protein
MSVLEQRIMTLANTRLAVIADRRANLKAQLLELERLRERVGKVVPSAEKSGHKQKVSCAALKSSVSPLS